MPLSDTQTIRMAELRDAELIASQRHRMFVDAGQSEAEAMANMAPNFAEWVRPRLQDGSYLGWLVEEQGHVIGGAGMWIMEFPPHWMDASPCRAYLLNFYVKPSHRGQRLSQKLLDLALAEASHRRIDVVSLHASKFGRPIYERNGFTDSTEMMLWRPSLR